MSFGHGWLGDTPGFNGDVTAALRSIKAKALFIYTSAGRVLSAVEDRSAGEGDPRCARGIRIDSDAGTHHLVQRRPASHVAMGDAIKSFLSELTAQQDAAAR